MKLIPEDHGLMPTRYDVFLSHSSADKPAVEAIARQLQDAGIKPFLDKWHLIPGRVWQEDLEKALEESRACAIFVGTDGLGPWAKQEMRVVLDRGAQDEDFPVIPVLLPGVRQPARLPAFLKQRTWVEFTTGVDDPGALHRLVSGIRGEQPGPEGVQSIRPPKSNAPPPPDDYVSRTEYDQIIEALCSNSGESGSTIGITTAFRGAGGFGKTTLAQKVCQDPRIQERFPDGILWTTMGEKADAAHRLTQIRELIRFWTGEEPIHFETVNAAGSHFKELLRGKKALLVIDDAWKPEDVATFNGLGQNSAILVTTRDSRSLPGGTVLIPVNSMNPDEAIQLLSQGLPKEIAGLDDFSEELGRWPLLLKLVGSQLESQIREHGLPATETLQRIRRKFQVKGITGFDVRDSDARETAVARTLDVGLLTLPSADRERFGLLAVFQEDADIPLSVLECLWKLDEFETEDLCRKFYEKSLIIRFDLAERTIRIHDVLWKYLAEENRNVISDLHLYLLDAVRPKTGHWVDLPKEESYLWRNLAYHLLECGEREVLRELLLDFFWLRAKLLATEINALLVDYAALRGSDEEIRLVQGTLRLSARILAKEPGQLASQLLGRLLWAQTPGIRQLLKQCQNWHSQTWLRPRLPSLTSPGEPLLRTLEGHTSLVTAVAVVDGRRAISASEDGTLRVWDLETGQTLRTLEGHIGGVRKVALVDSRRAVSASKDGTLRVWDLETGQTLLQSRSWPEVMAVVDARRIVYAYYDGVLVLDLETGGILQNLRGTGWVRALAVVDGRRVISSDVNTILVWDLETGQILRTFKHTGLVRALAVVDGRRAVSASYDLTLRIWDLETGRILRTLKGHTGPVNAVAVVDGQHVVSASDDWTLRVWDLETGQSLERHTLPISAVAVVDSRRAVSASDDWTLRVWDLDTGQVLQILEGHTNSVNAMAVVDSRRVVSVSPDGTLRVWDLETGQTLRTLKGHTFFLVSAVAVVDGRRAVCASDDRTLQVRDLETGQTLRSLEGHILWVSAVAVVDGRRAVSASIDGTLRVWDLDTGQTLQILEGHTDWVGQWR